MHESDYFEVGQAVYFWTEIRNRFKALSDPTSVELHIKPPVDALIVVSFAELVHESTGRFSHTQVMTEPGLWKYAFHSDEPDDVDGDRFHVSNSSHP